MSIAERVMNARVRYLVHVGIVTAILSATSSLSAAPYVAERVFNPPIKIDKNNPTHEEAFALPASYDGKAMRGWYTIRAKGPSLTVTVNGAKFGIDADKTIQTIVISNQVLTADALTLAFAGQGKEKQGTIYGVSLYAYEDDKRRIFTTDSDLGDAPDGKKHKEILRALGIDAVGSTDEDKEDNIKKTKWSDNGMLLIPGKGIKSVKTTCTSSGGGGGGGGWSFGWNPIIGITVSSGGGGGGGGSTSCNTDELFEAVYVGPKADNAPVPEKFEDLRQYAKEHDGMAWLPAPANNTQEEQTKKGANEFGVGAQVDIKKAKLDGTLRDMLKTRYLTLIGSMGMSEITKKNFNLKATQVFVTGGWDPKAEDPKASATSAMRSVFRALTLNQNNFALWGTAIRPSLWYSFGLGPDSKPNGRAVVQVDNTGQDKTKVVWINGANNKQLKSDIQEGPGAFTSELDIGTLEKIPAFIIAKVEVIYGQPGEKALKAYALSSPIYPKTQYPVRSRAPRQITVVGPVVTGSPERLLDDPRKDEVVTVTTVDEYPQLTQQTTLIADMGADTPVRDCSPTADVQVSLIDGVSPTDSVGPYEVLVGHSPVVEEMQSLGVFTGDALANVSGGAGTAFQYLAISSPAYGVRIGAIQRLCGTVVEGLGQKGPRTAYVSSGDNHDHFVWLKPQNDSNEDESSETTSDESSEDETNQIPEPEPWVLKGKKDGNTSSYLHRLPEPKGAYRLSVKAKGKDIDSGGKYGLVFLQTFNSHKLRMWVGKDGSTKRAIVKIEGTSTQDDQVLANKKLDSVFDLTKYHLLTLHVVPQGEKDAHVVAMLDGNTLVNGVFSDVPRAETAGVFYKDCAAYFKKFSVDQVNE